jgi:hypothetical protein
MSDTLLARLIIDCAGAAEHWDDVLREFHGGKTTPGRVYEAEENLRKAVAVVKKQREYLKAHGEWPEKL